MDLKDKIKTGSVVAGNAGTIGTLVSAANAQVQEEAVAALTMPVSYTHLDVYKRQEQIDRGYQNIEGRLNALGARITRIE